MKRLGMKRWLIWLAVLIFILSAVFAGCGSSSGDSAAKAGNASGNSGAGMTFGADGGYSDTADSGGADVISEADAAGPAEAGEAGTAQATDGAAADSGTYEQKLIRTVNLTVETTDFDHLVQDLKAQAQAVGGYTESSEVNTSSVNTQYGRWAYLTLRIPADRLDAFLGHVSETAHVTYSNESTEDVTLTYTDMAAHVEALRAEQQSLLSMLEQAESMEDILAIQSQLTQVRYEIESYESQLRVYDNRVNYSTVYLDINEVERETSASGVTFGERAKVLFRNNLYRIGTGFTNFAVGFLGAIPFLIIFAVILGIILFILKRRKKIKERYFVWKYGMKGEEPEEKQESEEKKI